MKKILLVHHCSNIGGGLKSGLYLCNIIHELGYEVHLLIPKITDFVSCNLDGINIISSEFDINTFSYYNGSGNILRAILQYFQHKKGLEEDYFKELFSNYDLIIFNSMTSFPMFIYTQKLGIMTGVFIRETLKHNRKSFINNWIMKKFVKLDFLAFISRHDMCQWKMIDKDKKFTVYNTYTKTKDETSNYMREKKIVNFLYVGGMNEAKGIEDLLKACLLLAEEEYILTIIGDMGKIRNNNLIENIIYRKYNSFLNRVSQLLKNEIVNRKLQIIGLTDNVGKYYLCSDIIVFPAKYVHQARPIIEAGAYEKAVIIPDFQNYSEFVDNGENGLKYKHGSYRDLAVVMKKCIDGKEDLKKMGQKNYQRYLDNHTLAAIKKQLMYMFGKIW